MKYSMVAVMALYPLFSLAAPAGSPAEPVLRKRVDIDTTATSPSTYDYTKDTYQMRYHKNCSPDQVSRITLAVAEAGYLANALQQWVPKGAYQNSMDFYMGYGSSGAQQAQIQSNIQREWGLHTNNVGVKSSANVYCDESVFQDGRKSCVGTIGAYSWSEEIDDGTWRHGVVLCPYFWDDTTTPTLASRIGATRSNTASAKSMAAIYGNIGQVWLHETMHWEQTVTQPRAIETDPAGGPKIYGPQLVSQVASNQGAGVTAILADAYTMAAESNFLMQTFGLSRVPVPYKISWALESIDVTSSPPLIDPNDALPGLANISTTAASRWFPFAASDAKLDSSAYLPMPVTYPLCTDPKDTKCNYISSCGNKAYWMPVTDFTGQTQSFPGYQTVVTNFCNNAAGAVIAPGYKYKDIWAVGMDQGGDPSKKGKAGYLNFEINNKFTDTHYVSRENCIKALMALAAPGQDCYGPDNQDCKGGTFQVGKDQISYHALGSWAKHDELLVNMAVLDETAQDDPDADADADDGTIWDKTTD
jgi:hypothetical protein